MICAFCTKDACGNHLCDRCGRCSDCCECEVRLEEPLDALRNGAHAVPAEPFDATEGQFIVDEIEAVEVVETEDTAAEISDQPDPEPVGGDAPPEELPADSIEAPPAESEQESEPPRPEHHE